MPSIIAPPPMGESEYVIRVVQRQWQHCFQQGNAAGMATLYTAAGQIMPAYSTAISGRPAIQAFWQGCFDMGICAMPRETAHFDWLANTVNEVGTYRFLDSQHRLLDVGKYVMIWKAHHRQWQIHCEIWTSNLPMR